MKTLILYSSHDGQTKKIAEFIAKHLQQDITVQSLTESAVDLQPFSQVIIGASIRYGHFNKQLYQFIENNYRILNEKNSGFFGVNLTARKAEKNTPQTNLYVKKFLERIKWKPKQAAVFAGALLYPRYTLFDRLCIRLIMKLTGGETDPTKEIEYTDWQKVQDFADLFIVE
ncbi:menaquinone-dependent protoporphyrinogen oxidase [Cricetibacter osteomyelitidis]|uniref:Protoporphyrinogen IX dehydrogenase [quinone] n=1 Tax=Cricetibacter osteomyelitidis TaxID=1521931 RepID=A0A4R2SL61_9PAST|nr:menaquinone-dependent protoporphyrinogen IX dehydrogenase [Cricetibacter osteomyelitidis]TCP88796.1 menaquinone-dependent protoporphyrinogen oxidase [Cricetibacter osteomyelitidis]